MAELRLRAPLVNDAGVIRALVVVAESHDGLPCFHDGERPRVVGELLGQRQQQRREQFLGLWLNFERPDKCSRPRFALLQPQTPPPLGDGPPCRPPGLLGVKFNSTSPPRDGKKGRGGIPSTASPPDRRASSTTRSLSGMIALSVIVMLSGQTFVQHFVMLQ